MLSFVDSHILVVGDLMLDRYWQGETQRISPEAPVPVVRVTGDEDRLGGAGNVARNIRALGGHATVVGVVGADANGERVRALLAADGCRAELVERPGWETVTKLRVISRHQQLIRLDFEQALPPEAAGDLAARCSSALSEVSTLVLSDYAKGALADPAALIAAARDAGKPVVVDPKRRDLSAYRGATVLTPNLGEFEAAVGPCRDESELLERAHRLVRDLELGALVITRSEHGMTVVGADGQHLTLPAEAREVYDVTGAGDTVVATLAMGVAAGLDIPHAAALANSAAGIVVGKLGTAVVTRQELEAVRHQRLPAVRGVVDEAALFHAVAAARQRGERIVMTNGCFDILHPGHVAYLEQAANLGDRLVVAVNDDASVTRLKGPDRPVNSLAQRMAVLAGLRSVDWVVPFGEDTPERLICAVKPDYLVKGGDYRPDEIAGSGCVRAAGGEVVVLDFVEGFSTTAIIKSLGRDSPSR